MAIFKLKPFFLCFLLLSLVSGRAMAQCNNLTLVDTVNVCASGTVSVTATVTDTSLIDHIIWYPGTGVSDTNNISTTITIGATSAIYHIAVGSLDTTELVDNRDFSLGNTGFSSSYTYSTTTTSPGKYGLGTNPYAYNTGFPRMGDHTTGTGNMMVVDGSLSAGLSVWCQTITVIPYTYYDFSAWAALLASPSPSIVFTINSATIGSTFTLGSVGAWSNFTYRWYSGSATSANICITDASTVYGGNDFALDDISFRGICIDTDSVYVNVINPVAVHLGADVSVCAGATATFASSDIYTSPAYLWSTGSTASNITTSTPGTYWLRVTESGCTGYDTVVFATRPYPIINLGIDSAFCTGSSYILNPTPSASAAYLWNTGATTGSISVTTPGTYWVMVDSNGCRSSDTIRVAEKPIPAVDLGNDVSLCAGTPLTLSSSVTYSSPTYSWSTGSSASSISPTTTGTYILSVTVRGCTGSDVIDVEFRRHPVANLGRDTSFCFGSTYTLTLPSGDDAYLWSTGSTSNSIVVTSTGRYWVQVDSVGCSSSDTVNITQVPAFGVHLGPDTAVCTISPIALQSSDIYTGIATYQWNTGSTSSVYIATASGTYVLAVNQLGCVVKDTINVVIKYDSINLTNNDTAICKGKSVQVVAYDNQIGGTYTYQWLPSAGIPFSATLSPYITPDTSATYVLEATTPGCPPLRDSFKIDVQPNPISVYIGGNRFMCAFDSIHINASVTPSWYSGYSYSWTPATDLDFSTTKDVVFNGTSSTRLFLTVTTSAGCNGKDSADINVTPGNFATVSPDQQLCPGDSVVLTASGGDKYHWYPWLYTSDSLAASVMVHPIASISYRVVVTESHGCTDTVTTTIVVHPAALLSLDDSVHLYPGESIHLLPLSNCTSFQWFPPAGLSGTTISDPVANPDVSTKYFVFGTTADGCKAIDSIDVTIEPESILFMPNAFTPGNGNNHTLKILKRGVALLNYFRIYNRWGNVVFETKNIDEGWDGSFNGAPQPLGVYVYDIQATTTTGKLISLHGNVTLLR